MNYTLFITIMKFTTLASNAFDDLIVKLVLGMVVSDSMPSFAVESIGVRNIKSFAPMLALATVTVPYIPVASGFNGLCIFRREAILGLRYSAVPTPEMNAEYKAMNCIPPLAKNANTHLNGASAGIYLFPNDNDSENHKNNHKNNAEDKGIFYFHNSGYNFTSIKMTIFFYFRKMKENEL